MVGRGFNIPSPVGPIQSVLNFLCFRCSALILDAFAIIRNLVNSFSMSTIFLSTCAVKFVMFVSIHNIAARAIARAAYLVIVDYPASIFAMPLAVSLVESVICIALPTFHPLPTLRYR